MIRPLPRLTPFFAILLLACHGDPPADTDADTDVDTDTDTACQPLGPEVCGGGDEDCDGATDEADAADATTWYADADGDSHGDPGLSVVACAAPEGHVATADDCDDSLATAHPGADESCNGRDDDCDGDTDEDDAVDAQTWYVDADGDGWGSPSATAIACEPPGDYVASSSDCDDSETGAAVNPGATEICENLADDDCDGLHVGCGPWGSVPADGADAVVSGAETLDGLGTAVAYGDLNGDGEPDALIGAPARTSWSGGASWSIEGAVYVFYGPITADELVGAADAALYGPVGVGVGTALAVVGDTNADGVDDVLMGSDAGYAYLKKGPVSGDVVLQTASLTVALGDGVGAFGSSVAGAGDVNADGKDDLLVGDPEVSTRSGAAYLYRGNLVGAKGRADAALVVSGAASGDLAGDALAGLGDWDGDGVPDVAIGASRAGEGEVAVFGGSLTGAVDWASADVLLGGEGVDDAAGAALSGPGDVDGDGYADVLVGAPGNDRGATDAGAVYLVLGGGLGSADLSAAAAIFVGDAAGDRAGDDLAAGGDLDASGATDLAIGAPGGSGQGRVFVLYDPPTAGVIGLGTAAAVLEGTNAGDGFGADVAIAGDADGDGYDDVLTGAPAMDGDAVDGGRGYLFFGSGL